MISESTKDFYNKISMKYDWLIYSWERSMRKYVDILDPIMKEFNVTTILDCACGTGLQSIGLIKAGYNVTSSDFSIEMLNSAKIKALNYGVELDIIETDFREIHKNIPQTYDAIICLGNSFANLLTDDDINKALRSVYSSLNPKGIFIIDILDFENLYKNKVRFSYNGINIDRGDELVSIIFVYDYLEKTILFNIIYLIQEKISGHTRMETESVEYNPINEQKLLESLERSGFKCIKKLSDPNTKIYVTQKDV